MDNMDKVDDVSDSELVEIYHFWSESFYSWLDKQEKKQEAKEKLYAGNN